MSKKKSSKYELDLVIHKFKDKKGLITATNLREAGIARNESAQYRRDLMALIVKKGDAWCNGKEPIDNKYAIYFNTIEGSLSSDEAKKYFFSPAVLLSPVMIDLPPKEYLPPFSTPDQTFLWLQLKSEWTEIYRGLCQFQNEGKIELTNWNIHWGKDLRDNVKLKIKRYIQTYKVCQLGCDEMLRQNTPLSVTADALFVTILKADSIDDFYGNIYCRSDTIKHQSYYNYLSEILLARKSGINIPDQYDKNMEKERELLENTFKLLAKNSATYEKFDREELGVFASAYLMQEYFGTSDNQLLKEALEDLQEAITDELKFTKKLYRRGKDSKDERPTGGWTADGYWLTDTTAMTKNFPPGFLEWIEENRSEFEAIAQAVNPS